MIKEQHKNFLARYGSKEHHDELVHDPDFRVRGFLAYNKNLHPDHIDQLLHHSDYDIKSILTSHPNLNHEQLDGLARMHDPSILYRLAEHPNIKDHLHTLIDSTNVMDASHNTAAKLYLLSLLRMNDHLDKTHLEKLINDPYSNSVREAALARKNR